MGKVVIMDHPLIQHKIGFIRRIDTGTRDFRQTISALTVAQEMLVGQRDLSIGHAFTLAPGDVERYAPALLLGEAGHDGQKQLALGIEGPYVLFLKIDLGAMLFQLTDGG